MIRLFSTQTIILILTGLVLAASVGLNGAYELLQETSRSAFGHWRLVGIAVTILVFAFSHPIVWRLCWRIPVLGSYAATKTVPDLNGFWLVTVQSNFPVMQSLAEYASSKKALKSEKLPNLSAHQFLGKLSQGWFSSKFEIYGNDGSVLDSSDTILFEFRRGNELKKPEIYWIYRQSNKQVSIHDSDKFEGATHLVIHDKQRISGLTWSNREWRSGKNTAGPIVLERVSSLPILGLSDSACREKAAELFQKHIASDRKSAQL